MRRSTTVAWGVFVMGLAAAALPVQPVARAYDERGPEPTASYTSLEAARDSIGVMVGRAVQAIRPPHHREMAGAGGASADTMIQVTRAPAKFKHWYADHTGTGWTYRIVIRDKSECPMMKLEYALDAAGWSPDHGYAVDAPDGSVMGFVSKGFACVIESSWDPVDDSDKSYVPSPGCEVLVTCVPRRPDDVPKW